MTDNDIQHSGSRWEPLPDGEGVTAPEWAAADASSAFSGSGSARQPSGGRATASGGAA